MRLLSRLERPSAGRILCEGQDIARLSGGELLRFRRKLQLVLQDPFDSLPPRTAIGAMLEAPLRIHGWRDAARIRDKVRAVMNDVGLSPASTTPCRWACRGPAAAHQRRPGDGARSRDPADGRDPLGPRPDRTVPAARPVRQAPERPRPHLHLHQPRPRDGPQGVQPRGRDVSRRGGGARRQRAPVLRSGHPYTRALLSAMPTLEERRYRPRIASSTASRRARSTCRPAAPSARAVRGPSPPAPGRAPLSSRGGRAISPPATTCRPPARVGPGGPPWGQQDESAGRIAACRRACHPPVSGRVSGQGTCNPGERTPMSITEQRLQLILAELQRDGPSRSTNCRPPRDQHRNRAARPAGPRNARPRPAGLWRAVIEQKRGDQPFEDRARIGMREKARIASAALPLVEDG